MSQAMSAMMENNIVRSKITFQVPEVSLGAYYKNKIDQILASEPNKISVIDPRNDEHLALKDLDLKARTLAYGLVAWGKLESVRDRVYFFGDNSLDYLVAMFAVHYVGVCYSPGTPANGPHELVNQLADLEASALVVSVGRLPVIERILKETPEQAQILAKLKFILILEDDDSQASKRLSQLTSVKVCSFQALLEQNSGQAIERIAYFQVDVHADYCMVVYTSGTTGLPKGAIHSSYSMVASMHNLAYFTFFSENQGARALATFPLGHMSGSYLIPGYVMAKMTVVLMPNASLDAPKLMQVLEKYRIEAFSLPPTLSMAMAETNFAHEFDLSHLKAFFFGSTKYHEHVIRAIAKRYNMRPYEGYGCTEMVRMVGEVSARTCSIEQFEFGCLGPPMPNVEMKIIDTASGEALPAHKQGEICFRGPNRFVGYLKNEKATRETIDSEGWYRTGDLGYYDHDGGLYITDRIKEIIKYKAWSVSPTEVETFLTTHPAVVGACVVGVPHRSEGAHLRAYIEKKTSNQLSEQELIDYVEGHMGMQKRLHAGAVILDAPLARSVTGKLDRAFYRNLVKGELLTRST